MGRVAAGLVILASLLAPAALATTAPSLSSRIHIDGVLDEYAADEWVLDSASVLPETDRDSGWGRNNDISRLAVTWDHEFLYLAVEGRAFDTFLSLLISNRAGGLATLENAGAFRRAIDLSGLSVNIIALASPERTPDVARADDSHPFALVDRAAIPAVIAGARTGPVGFEMAVPWSMLSLSNPVRLVAAITGETGTGAGDAAPDASVRAVTDRFVRAVLDRRLVFDADTDNDGLADSGVSPRAAAAVDVGTITPRARAEVTLSIGVSPRAFAPDRGESAQFTLRMDSVDQVFASAAVYSLDGDCVRTLFTDEARVRAGNTLAGGSDDAWDGTDDRGVIVRGGAYVLVVEWGFARGERSNRSTAAVVVVR